MNSLTRHGGAGKNFYMPRKASHTATLTKALKQAIESSGLSFKEIERRTGVLRQTLMRFVKGEGSIRLDQADKLASFLSLKLMNEFKQVSDYYAQKMVNYEGEEPLPIVHLEADNKLIVVVWHAAPSVATDQVQSFIEAIPSDWPVRSWSLTEGRKDGDAGICVVVDAPRVPGETRLRSIFTDVMK